MTSDGVTTPWIGLPGGLSLSVSRASGTGGVRGVRNFQGNRLNNRLARGEGLDGEAVIVGQNRQRKVEMDILARPLRGPRNIALQCGPIHQAGRGGVRRE